MPSMPLFQALRNQMSIGSAVKRAIQTPPQQKRKAPPFSPPPQPAPEPQSVPGPAPNTPGPETPIPPTAPDGGAPPPVVPPDAGAGATDMPVDAGTPPMGAGAPIFGEQSDDLNPYAMPSMVNPFLAPFLTRLALQGLLGGNLGERAKRRLPGPSLNPYNG